MGDKKKLKMIELCELKEKLICDMKAACCESPICQMNASDIVCLGEVADMIKDLSEAEKNCWEAMQAESIVEAMKEAKENPWMYEMMPDNVNMGYDRNRYASGRFAPKGHGDMTRGGRGMGYNDPSWAMNMFNPDIFDRGEGIMEKDSYDPKHGEPYNKYKMARRHYSDTHSMKDREEMDEHAKEYMNQVLSTTKEIYDTSSPELRKKFKDDMIKMVKELPDN